MSRRVKVKPGKAQSMSGFIVGILFCFIGLFFVIPTFKGFGVIWTLVAVVITVMNGLNAFTDQGIASHEITIEEEELMRTPTSAKTSEERLNELQSLFNKGMISYEEYQEKRKKILEEL